MNPLRVVPTHLASLNQLAEEGATNQRRKFENHVPVAQLDRATSNTPLNLLRVASTHPASLNQLVEEEAAVEK